MNVGAFLDYHREKGEHGNEIRTDDGNRKDRKAIWVAFLLHAADLPDGRDRTGSSQGQ